MADWIAELKEAVSDLQLNTSRGRNALVFLFADVDPHGGINPVEAAKTILNNAERLIALAELAVDAAELMKYRATTEETDDWYERYAAATKE